MKQSHWLLCIGKELWLVQANHATVKLDWASLLSEARIELRNLQFLNKMLEKSSQFHQISPVSRKAWMLSWILQELKNTLGKLAITVNLETIRFEFWTERSVSDDGNLCPLWSVIFKSVWNSVGENCDRFRQITPLSNLFRVLPLVEWKLTAKAELNCKIYKFWWKCWINRVSFCHQRNSMNQRACRSRKNTLGKFAIAVNLEAIRVEFWTERSVGDGGNSCPLWSVIPKSV